MNILRGKTVLITGATSGIGEQTAYALAEMGAKLLLVCRDRDKGEVVAHNIRTHVGADLAKIIVGDLASLAQVRQISEVVLEQRQSLDVLVNNAGVFNMHRSITADGYEEMFAVNYLAHFLLTNLLLERIKKSNVARIINIGSGAHKLVKEINFEDLSFVNGFRPLKVYSHSKLANVLFNFALSDRLAGTGVTANLVDPGEVATNLGSQNGMFGSIIKKVMSYFLQSSENGAATSVYACSSSDLDGVSGQYLRKSAISEACDWATDRETARLLWETSEKLVQNNA